MFSYLFGGSKSRKHGTSNSNSALPSSSSSSFPPTNQSSTSRPSGDYDDVALDGSGGSPSNYRPDPSSAYPPVPSFSRPSFASASSSARYPPLSATFTRLTNLLDAQSPALLDSLAPPLSSSDPVLSSLRNALAPYQIPSAVLDSYLIHDGQDSLSFAAAGGGGGGSIGGASGTVGGLVWGLWWMPLERVEEEWNFWRKLEAAGGKDGFGGRDPFSASVSSSDPRRDLQDEEEERRRRRTTSAGRDDEEEEEEGMSSFPPGWVRRKYTHPGWLPLLTDRCGNYIGVDLDPPSPSSAQEQGQKSYGQAGQVIAFGREIDEKVVLFPGDGSGGWARFLAAFVEDIERGEFARLGERPMSSSGSVSGGRERQSDEESLGDDDRSDGSGGSGEGENWNEDGLGERGYFETAGTYGEDVIDGVKGDSRSSSTWVLRAQFRRLATQTEGGVIGLLAERSRRKWRSLGIGSTQPRPQAAMSPRGLHQAALSVVTQNTPASSSTGVEVEEEPASAVTMKGSTSPRQTDPLSPNPSEHNVEVTLSPPSPKGNPAMLPPLDTTSTPPTTSPRTSQDYHRNSSQKSPQSPDGFLRDPPRAYKASQRNPLAQSQSQPRARRNPPPPPAPISVPIFSDLDFSEQSYNHPSPLAPHSPNLGAEDPVSSSTSALGRLSFSSQRSGERTPTTPGQQLLPTSRSNSMSSSSGDQLHRPAPIRPAESSTSISMLNDLAERSTTALVPGRDIDDDSIHLASPTFPNGTRDGGVEVVVMDSEGGGAGGETGSGLRRVASPLDSPYEEQGEFAAPLKSPRLV
ncbi:Smi1p [Sporobolomyces salmoneus]|uniref:Smi1p n=1 Tax=Sporobolomyces salmoneus TaxID=183962 RepID=UPI00316D5581